MRALRNPDVDPAAAAALRAPAAAPLAFHRRMPGYAPAPVVELPDEGLVVKLETDRFGLPAFKALGAWWAAHRALCERLGGEPRWSTVDELREAYAPLRPLALVAATDGNHGRAVARYARLAGLGARILVPESMAAVRREAIAAEGAQVEIVAGSYDDAVARSAQADPQRELIVSDTAWAGYERVPSDVIDGYSTIFQELEGRLSAPPDLVMVQMGVGSLAAACVANCRARWPETPIIGVEPLDAACVLAAIEAGGPVLVPGPHRSSMAGLNAGLPATIALPALRLGIDAFVAVEDAWADLAGALLRRHGLEGGEPGAAGLAGLLALREDRSAVAELSAGAQRVMLVATEGPTGTAPHP